MVERANGKDQTLAWSLNMRAAASSVGIAGTARFILDILLLKYLRLDFGGKYSTCLECVFFFLLFSKTLLAQERERERGLDT